VASLPVVLLRDEQQKLQRVNVCYIVRRSTCDGSDKLIRFRWWMRWS